MKTTQALRQMMVLELRRWHKGEAQEEEENEDD